MNFYGKMVLLALIVTGAHSLNGAVASCPKDKICFCTQATPTGKVTKDGSEQRSVCYQKEEPALLKLDSYKGETEQVQVKCLRNCLQLSSEEISEIKREPYGQKAKKAFGLNLSDCPKGKKCDCRGPREKKVGLLKKVYEVPCFAADDSGISQIKVYQGKDKDEALAHCNRFCPGK